MNWSGTPPRTDCQFDNSIWTNLRIRAIPALLAIGLLALLVMPSPYAHLPSAASIKQAVGRGYLIHLLAYFTFTVGVLFACRPRDLKLTTPILVAHAVLSELAQIPIATRDSDPLDAVANLAGIAAGTGCWLISRNWNAGGSLANATPVTSKNHQRSTNQNP